MKWGLLHWKLGILKDLEDLAKAYAYLLPKPGTYDTLVCLLTPLWERNLGVLRVRLSNRKTLPSSGL